MTNSLIPFLFESHDIRVINRDGEPWFVLADICSALDLSNPSQVATRLDDDEKDTLHRNDGISGLVDARVQSIGVINESGLWSLAVRSDKPAAKRLRKWVTSEVIPSIRKTGHYGAAPVRSDEDVLVSLGIAPATAAILIANRRDTQLALEHSSRALAVSEEARELAAAAEAKAQATAMASQDFSIMAWGNLHGMQLPLKIANMLGKRASAMSRQRGAPCGQASDPRFGMVKTYMSDILEEVFDIYERETRPKPR